MRVVGGIVGSAEGDGGYWNARIRFVVLGRGIDFDSRTGSEASSSESESESEPSSCRSVRLKLLSFSIMSSLSFVCAESACVPATAKTVAG